MKVIKTASGKNRIKISKSEWTSIGKKAGWMKEAMPMKTEDDLPSLGKGAHISINDSDFDSYGELYITILCPSEEYGLSEIGNIFIAKTLYRGTKDPGRWDNTYYVTDVNAEKGWGPLLYDTALKYLSKRGKYLISNIEATSRLLSLYGNGTSYDAAQVWKHYDEKRDDVNRTPFGYQIMVGEDSDDQE